MAEIAGMGVQSSTPINAPPERVWTFMVDKMYNPEKYIPVTNVTKTIIEPEQHIYREMTYNEKRIKENVYFDKTSYKIRCVSIDEDITHINIFHLDTGYLEYWQENGKGERILWKAPKAVVLAAIEKTKQLAEENN